MIMVQTKLKSYHNKNLFSNYYLENLILELAESREEKGIEEVFLKIKELYNRIKKDLKNLNEFQLEDEFIKPILSIIGQIYEVQPPVSTQEGIKRPDYAFFPDENTKKSALKHLGDKEFFKYSIGIGDAKGWERSLDKKIKGSAEFANANPSWQIDYYLRMTETKWGILTNGRSWRLYNRDTSFKLDNYYEVDLVELLEKGDLDAFKYFYLFFKGNNLSFLDKVYNASLDYAKAIGENLKENVYDALKILADGFLKTPGNNIVTEINNIKAIHDNCFTLLYRLLFFFYAESRNLLDVDNEIYRDNYSIYALKKEISEKLDNPREQKKLLPSTTNYWHRLKQVFELINKGSLEFGINRELLYVPSYNGGLFDPEKNVFLEQYKVGDYYIAQVIDLLARLPSKNRKTGNRKEFVDYSSLSIRHLGEIYEGLLEYKLKIAEQDLYLTKEKGKEIYIPINDAKKKNKKIKKGSLYLVTDKGERKSSGSYYTPDYIVKYIVEKTVNYPCLKAGASCECTTLNTIETKK